jgi:RNA polymerase sigma-70 factor (ECF subfamily)
MGTDAIDDALIDALRGNDTFAAWSAFDRIVHAYGETLVTFAYRLTSDRDLAHDVTQDVFVWAWERRALLTQASSLRAYLYGAVRHRVIDQLRRERRSVSWRMVVEGRAPGMGTAGADPAAAVEASELDHAITAAMSSLPPRTHQIATLRWHDGLTPAEIAKILEISVSTVSNTLTTAAKTLRRALLQHRADRTG